MATAMAPLALTNYIRPWWLGQTNVTGRVYVYGRYAACFHDFGPRSILSQALQLHIRVYSVARRTLRFWPQRVLADRVSQARCAQRRKAEKAIQALLRMSVNVSGVRMWVDKCVLREAASTSVWRFGADFHASKLQLNTCSFLLCIHTLQTRS